jgi:hypothetical protein
MSFKIIASSNKKSGVKKVSKEDATIELASNDYVFAQASIVSSAMTEPNSFKIHPSTSKYINSNGDGWKNEALKSNYKSFIGAYNYVNHVQEHEKAVGFIGDAALRKIIVDPKENIYVYYVDILVVTHRDMESLVRKLLSNNIEFLSMGCEAETSQCSQCGDIFEDDESMCDHLTFSKGKYYIDTYGKKRIIAELLGDEKEGSCNFIEASYLTQVPASGMAVKRNILSIPSGCNVQLHMPKWAIEKKAVQKFVKV